MKVETNTIAPCRMRVAVKAEADETREDYEKVVRQYVLHGRIPGFRAGKAPRDVILRRFRDGIEQDARQQLISKLYRKALDGEKLAVVGILDVSDVAFSPDTGITFAMTVDVAPDFALPEYNGIAVKTQDATVPEEQVDAQIARMRDMAAKFDDAKEGEAVAEGDLVQVDFSATVDGAPLADLLGGEDTRNLGSGSGRWFQADSSADAYIPKLASGLVGMAVGETRDIPVEFPADYSVEQLRGKAATYSATVKILRKRTPATDAEFLEQYAAESLDTLRDHVRKGMQQSADRRENERRREIIIDHLLKKTEFDLPQSVVESETDNAVRSMLQDGASRGLSREELEKHREEILGSASTAARERVRLRYILARIAEAEKVTESDEEVETRIREMAAQYQMDAAKLRGILQERNAMENVRGEIRANKVIDLLLERAKLS